MNGGQVGPTFDAIPATKLLTSYQSITSGTTFTIALSNNQTKIAISGSSGGIFANSIATLNAGSFIPSGIWDMNIFASKSTLNTNVSLSFAVFGYNGSTSTQIGGISSISNSEDITDNVIEEYILSLTFPYVDISTYTYLYVQLYYTTTSGANGNNLYLAYQSASAYSHIHTTFGINSLITGVTAINTSGYINGATLTSTYYLELGQATTAYPGLITTSGQTFAGDKYFEGSVGVSGLLGVGNYSAEPTSGVTGSLYYNTAASILNVSSGTTWSNIATTTATQTFTNKTLTGATLTTPTITTPVISGSAVSTSYLDYSGTSATYANGATVDFSSFSGMIIVNNTLSTGNVQLWLCGGGSATKLGDSSTSTTQNGTIAEISGGGGYRWTNNTGSSQSISFGVIRTRTFS